MTLQSRCSAPVWRSARAHVVLLVTSANDSEPTQCEKEKKLPQKGCVLFLFSIYYSSPGSYGTAANNLLPCKKKTKNKNSVSLKENLASSKVMVCWTFTAFWKERKTRSEIYQRGFSALCDKQCRPFFLHSFFLRKKKSHFLKKWSSKKKK